MSKRLNPEIKLLREADRALQKAQYSELTLKWIIDKCLCFFSQYRTVETANWICERKKRDQDTV